MSDGAPPAAENDAGTHRVSLPNGSGGVLCTACGLCCMGALHDRAKLEPNETEWARSVGLPVTDAGLQFTLPCSKLVDRKCSIFEHRPGVCPRYRCKLLDDTDEGRVELDTALGLVSQAHELFSAAMDSLTVERLETARYRARDLSMAEVLEGSGTARDAVLAERLRVTALDVFLDRHFRNTHDAKMYKAAEQPGSGEMNIKETGEGNNQP